MTLLERIFTVWRRVVPDSGPSDSMRLRESKPHVPAEYLPLYSHLHTRFSSNVVLSFGEMEALLGFTLPVQARTTKEWWTDPSIRTARQADAWVAAERTARPNLSARNVAFERSL
jgi:hypothetical protein